MLSVTVGRDMLTIELCKRKLEPDAEKFYLNSAVEINTSTFNLFQLQRDMKESTASHKRLQENDEERGCRRATACVPRLRSL